MGSVNKPSYSWYKDLSLKEKSQWYGQIAVAYDKTRPRYPSQLITRAIEIAQLSPDAKILEDLDQEQPRLALLI